MSPNNGIEMIHIYPTLPPHIDAMPSPSSEGVEDDLAPSVGYSSPSPLLSQEGDKNLEFQTIPLDDIKAMDQMHNFFCNESSSSESDACSLELNADVHCEDFAEVPCVDSGFQSSRDPSHQSELMKVLQLSNSSLNETLSL